MSGKPFKSCFVFLNKTKKIQGVALTGLLALFVVCLFFAPQSQADEKKSLGPIATCVEKFFVEDDWKHEEIVTGLYRTGIKGEEASYKLIFHAKEKQDQLIILTITGQNIPEKNRAAVAEFLMRVNYELAIGNFEMDMDDGEIRFRVSVDVEHGTINTKMIKQMTYCGVITVDRFYPGIMAVCYGGKTPKEAYEKITNAEDE